MAETKQSIGKGFAVLSVASIVVKLLSLLFVPLMINILGDEGYGVFSITYQIYAFIYLIANSGIPVAVSKLVSELSERGHDASALKSFKISRTFLFVLGLFLALIMFLIAGPLSNAISVKEAKLAIQFLAPSIFFTSIMSAYRGYFQGRSYMTPTAITQIIEQVVHIFFSALFAYYMINDSIELGVAGGTLGTSIGALAALIVLIFMLNSYVKRGQAIHPDSTRSTYSFERLSKTLIKYAIPITLSSAIQYAGTLIDALLSNKRLIASGLSPENANITYGYLSKYQQLINVPISLITALSIAILPSISASLAVNDQKQVENKINYSFMICFIIAIPAAFGLSILSEPVYTVLKYRGGYQILTIGAFTLILTAILQIQTTILQSLNRLYYAIASLSVSVIIKLALNYILIGIPSIRIYGAVISTYISTFIAIMLNVKLLQNKENLNLHLLKASKKPLFSSIAMYLAILIIYFPLKNFIPQLFEHYLFNLVFIAVAILLGVIVYFVALAKLKGINADMVKSISGKLYKLLPKAFKKML